LAYPYK